MSAKLLKAAANAAATLDAVYQWVDQVEAAGGAATIEGISKCHAMLESLKKNRARFVDLVAKPLNEEIERAKGEL